MRRQKTKKTKLFCNMDSVHLTGRVSRLVRIHTTSHFLTATSSKHKTSGNFLTGTSLSFSPEICTSDC